MKFLAEETTDVRDILFFVEQRRRTKFFLKVRQIVFLDVNVGKGGWAAQFTVAEHIHENKSYIQL